MCSLKVLNGKNDGTEGGVLMLITDGNQDCPTSGGLDIDDPSVENRIIDTKVRIITVAFR